MDVEYFTWQDFAQAARYLTYVLSSFRSHIDGIYGIPRGGLVLAVALSHSLKLPLRDSVSSATLVVDDICDTGTTLKPYTSNLTATIHYKPGARVCPTVFYAYKGEAWIVYPWEEL
ncbi:MAG: hypothetical protein QW212_00720 [Nitrososphaerales archaeon]